MITAEMRNEAKETLVKHWGNDGKAIIKECSIIAPFGGNSRLFFDYCYACGGNWSGMLLSGICALFPTVWEKIPERMGKHAWECLCSALILCGVDTSE